MGKVFHKELASGRWFELDLVDQLGNVGSEVERTIRAHRAGNAVRFQSALARALELFDLTTSDPRWHGPRCQEIRRAREEFCRLFFDPDVPKTRRRAFSGTFSDLLLRPVRGTTGGQGTGAEPEGSGGFALTVRARSHTAPGTKGKSPAALSRWRRATTRGVRSNSRKTRRPKAG